MLEKKLAKGTLRDGGMSDMLHEAAKAQLCVKVDDHEDYHHHCYGDYYVSVSVGPFEYGHSSLPF
jgi:hypothetical protein